MNVLILGCGRVGSTLARLLSQDNNSVTVIDLTADSFRRLGSKFKGQKVVGTGMDQETLRRANIESADVFVCVTNGDNTNIMAAQIAKNVFNVSKVIARIYDPIRADAYRELGIDTLCTTTVAAGLILSNINQDQRMKPVNTVLEDLQKLYRDQVVKQR
jgi:trk system potassium uptake protein TrkA